MHPSSVRQIHASQVFHAIRVRQGVAQRELVEITGLDKSTISAIIQRFEQIGLVVRTPSPPDGRRGRPSELLKISELSGLLIGVHLEFESVRVVAGRLDGHPFACDEVPLPSGPDRFADVTWDCINRLCASVGASINDVRAVGVSLPGLVSRDDVLVQSSNLQWGKVAAGDLLKMRIAAPIFVDNDANAATLAEHLFGKCAGYSDFIMIDSGKGLGGGLFLDGRLYRGNSGFAGELGHIVVQKGGRPCGCGKAGCLSAYLSARALIDRASRVAPVHSIAEIIAAANDGDDAILFVLEEAGQLLGVALSTLVSVFNPPAIAFGGVIARLWPYLEQSARSSLKHGSWVAGLAPVELIVSTVSSDRVPWGGVALALEGFTSHDPNSVGTPW